MGKLIMLNFNQKIESKNNGVSATEIRLAQIKKDYYKQLKGKQDTVANYNKFLINSAGSIEEAYQLLGY